MHAPHTGQQEEKQETSIFTKIIKNKYYCYYKEVRSSDEWEGCINTNFVGKINYCEIGI